MYKVTLTGILDDLDADLPSEALELLEYFSGIMTRFLNRKTYKNKGVFEHWFEQTTCCGKLINLVQSGLVDIKTAEIFCKKHSPKELTEFLFPLGKIFAGS